MQKAPCPPDHSAQLCRVAVIGPAGAGKTTLAAVLAVRLGLDHVELDALHWEANWTMAPTPVFRARVAAATAGDRWVTDGNYAKARDLIWSRADTIVWLDYPLWLILYRLIRRTVRRVVLREQLWNGNRESLRTQIASRDSLFLWVLQTYGRHQREYAELLESPGCAHVHLSRLRSPGDTRRWLTEIRSSAAPQ